MRPRSTSSRAAVVLAAVALGVGLGAALRPFWKRDAPAIAFIDGTSPGATLPADGVARGRAVEGGRLERIPLDEKLVSQLMPLDKRRRVWDPWCYFRPMSDLALTNKKPWFPGGQIEIRTNSLGLRMDHEPADPRPDLRVLLVGDSHMAGVCSNRDCAAKRLEVHLANADASRSVEVINGSEGAYSFYNYLGVLERMVALELTPDVLVVVAYGGNDFADVNLWHFFTGAERPRRTREQLARLKAVAESHGAAVGQVLNAAEYFASTGEAEVANSLTMADQVIDEIDRRCAENGVELVVSYLPAPTEVPGTAYIAEVEVGLAELGIGEPDLDRVREIGDRFLAQVRARDLPAVDLRDAFRGVDRELYWRHDLHLNLDGHELVAQALTPVVEAAWQRVQERR